MHDPALLATVDRSNEGYLTQTRAPVPFPGIPLERWSCLPTMAEAVITMSTLGHLCSHLSLQMAWKTGGGQPSQADRGTEGLRDSGDPGQRNLATSECLGLTFPWLSLMPIPGVYQPLQDLILLGLI